MAQFEANKILDALENETNASIMNLTTSKIQKQKNDMLQRLQMPKSKLKVLFGASRGSFLVIIQ